MRRIDASVIEAPIIDFSKVETLGQLVTTLGALGTTKEEGRITSPSFLPTLLTVSSLWYEKQGKHNSLPTCTFGIGAIYAHHSWEELAQSLLVLWRIRRDSYMSCSPCIIRTYGKDIVHLCDLHVDSLTMYMQDVAPRRGILYLRLLGLHEAKSMIDDHPLDGLGEDVYFGGHAHHV